ncbi:unnamed protein product, partial [Symbiodinium sp. CCMP2456]
VVPMYCCCSPEEDVKATMVEVDSVNPKEDYKKLEEAIANGKLSNAETFTVKIQKQNGQSGLEFSKADTGVLTVSGVVQPGAVADWNDRCPPGQDIRLYDRVLRVNGKAGSAMDLLTALREEVEELEVVMERPRIREVEVRKEGRELGLVLFVSTANRLHSGLVVSMVKEGALVSDIKPHDRIIEVNGQVLPPSELLEGVRGEQLTMKICCYRC